MIVEVRWFENGKMMKKEFRTIREAVEFRKKLKEQGKKVL